MKPYVFITRKLKEELIAPLKEIAHVEMWENEEVPCPRELLLKKSSEADALLTMLSDQVDEELLEVQKNLKVVSNLAVGYDNIDIEGATRHHIAVCNTPDVLTETTADLTFALLMATARRIVEAAEFVKEGKWTGWSPFLLAGSDIHHKTIGIVGMGNIGQAVAKRAKGFSMNVLYHNRTRKVEAEKEIGAHFCSFYELLEKSDFVVCLTPLTKETKHLFNKDAFERMKGSAIFINAARGAVVDEEALYDALMTKKIKAAGLDVFKEEPINEQHPLLTLKNVVALPHIGSASMETREKMMTLCVENIIQILSNKEPITLVNKEWMEQ
nr:D-glycerate dehydrogenase [Bacillus sp. FJAT-47783]